MIYQSLIETPALTANSAPKNTILEVCEGLVYRIEIHFPQGNCGNHGLKICRGANQVWPSSTEQWFLGSGEVIAFDDLHILDQPPYRFEILSYNNDLTYDHTAQVLIGIVLAEVYKAHYLPTLAWADFWSKWEDLVRLQEEIMSRQQLTMIPTIII